MLKSKFNDVLILCSIVLGLATVWSCNSEPEENPKAEIALQSPANNADIDLSEVETTTFSWTAVAEITAYTLKFSPTESELATTSVKIDAGNVSSYAMSSQAADILLAGNTSLQPGESTDMFWTVVPTVSVADVKTQVRKFHITRLSTTVTPNLSISTESLVFAANPSAAQTVTVTANTEWQVSITQTGEWLAANPAAGSGDGSISVTAAENTGTERTATITISGTGVESKTVNVTQAAKASGGIEGLLGTWNMKMAEYTGVEEENGREYKVSATTRYAATFTLNRDGSFTGEIPDIAYADNDVADPGYDATKTWSHTGDSVSWNDGMNVTATCKVTVTSSEMVLERGTPGTGRYAKATYTRETVNIPLIPDRIDNLYTGSSSVFHGVWILTKSEDNHSQANGDRPTWYTVSFNPNDEVMTLTVNADGAFQMANNIEGETSGGTWSFANGTLTIVTNGETNVFKVEAESSVSTLVWGSIHVDATEKSYSRMTWTKKQ
jgi:hypothetical protein